MSSSDAHIRKRRRFDAVDAPPSSSFASSTSSSSFARRQHLHAESQFNGKKRHLSAKLARERSWPPSIRSTSTVDDDEGYLLVPKSSASFCIREYRLGRQLGMGTFGKVYLAYKGHIPVALKVIKAVDKYTVAGMTSALEFLFIFF